MNSDRKSARIIGGLFILATVMGVTNAVLLGPILATPDYLTAMFENAATVRLSILLNVIMASAVAAIAVFLYPILKRENEALAAGYLVARSAEGIVLLLGGIAWFALIQLGAEFVQIGQPADSYLVTFGALFANLSTLIFTFGAEIIFGLTAIILNILFIRAKLVPKFLSLWGLVGGALLLTLGVVKVLGLPYAMIEAAFTAPIALNEMVLAVWLIVKGFSPSSTKAV